MKPREAERLADAVIEKAEEYRNDPLQFRMYLLGMFITLIHPMQAHNDLQEFSPEVRRLIEQEPETSP